MLVDRRTTGFRECIPADWFAIPKLFFYADVTSVLQPSQVGAQRSVCFLQQLLEPLKGETVVLRQQYANPQPHPMLEEFVEAHQIVSDFIRIGFFIRHVSGPPAVP